MESIEFLKALEAILIASALAVLALHYLKVPSIVGFFAAGAIIGPSGLGVVKDLRSIEVLAEVGVILLLFTIGIEFSLTTLMRMKRAVVGGGILQMILTIAISAFLSYLVTGHARTSVFYGFLVALSSTAIVLKLLMEKGEIDSPQGRTMMSILIFQDLCVVPLMLLIPTLSGSRVDMLDVAFKMGKAALIIMLIFLGARWAVPSLLHQVVHTRSRELFITTIVLLCLGIALLTAHFGLSLALGAFLAGLVISESEYAHQATSDVLPLRDSFIGLFFVSIGMLLDIRLALVNIRMIAVVVVGIVGIKILTGALSALAIGIPLRVALHSGLGLAQAGEFSFILALAGKQAGLVTETFYQVFLSSSVATMIAAPFLLAAAPAVSAWVGSRRVLRRLQKIRRSSEEERYPRRQTGHVLIVGFGLNGRNLARVLKEAGVPYAVLELNSDTVQDMKRKGEPIYFGDGTSREILGKLGLLGARLLVVAISDPVSTRRIVSVARRENPSIHVIVRTRYLAEVEDLKKLGADEVIPEEFETSVEIFSRVLHRYHFPSTVIAEMVEAVRRDSYTALRGVDIPRTHLFPEHDWLPEMEIDGYRIPEGSAIIGKSIAELQVRKKTGITIMAVRRGSEVHTNPRADFRFQGGDIVLFTGERERMDSALRTLRQEKKDS
jgi:monovalent cation:H+ antiporter-2, CPA2 family